MQVAGRVSTLSAVDRLLLLPARHAFDRAPGTCARRSTAAARRSIKTFTAPFVAGDGAGPADRRLDDHRLPQARRAAPGRRSARRPTPRSPAGGYVSFTLGDTTIRGGAFGGGNVSGAAPSAPPRRRCRRPPATAGAPVLERALRRRRADHRLQPLPRHGGGRRDAAQERRQRHLLRRQHGRANGTRYYYRVAAVNSVGEGTQSNEASATPAAPAQRPAAPGAVRHRRHRRAPVLERARPTAAPPITGYNLYRGTAAGATTLLHEPRQRHLLRRHHGHQRHQVLLPRRGGQQRRRGHAVERGLGDAGGAPPPPLPFPRTATLDSFARPAGALGTNWQSPGPGGPRHGHDPEQRPDPQQRRRGSATWRTQTFTADQEAYMTVPTLPGGEQLHAGRGRVSTLSSADLSCYFLRVTPSTGTWDLRKKLNGAGSTSIKTFTAPVRGRRLARPAGDRLDAHRLPQARRRRVDLGRLRHRHGDPGRGLRLVHARRHDDPRRRVRRRQHQLTPAQRTRQNVGGDVDAAPAVRERRGPKPRPHRHPRARASAGSAWRSG